ncbi:polyketide cyclase/dehydrase/lipid transport protein [Halopolyspora algeriensis]|uniref:Polyketide cyclase/dehydrase/lipid transport protein n=1 Tax=Halopolyspora algeriensis TaxID=1500506 RepID=A0A368VVH9_9ACTN|nr:SRPBCC family protein [Halopolyspora algeriensis]RCW45853.1 polyketide cyclase/dehydrase/lipid transport protein [Halopolyspora algeriensis]TQM55268.1 polyketide cyclase/dehydrase/lipid transport protein [Halopolyspora algeriensis]
MREGNSPRVECEVHVEADPDRVWELVTDIELPARFSPELQRVRWLDGADRLGLGARFEGHNCNQALGQWRTVSQVVELEAPRAFAWAVLDPDGRYGNGATDPQAPMATWRFDLTPAAGGTRLRHAARLGPARSGLDLAIEDIPDKEDAIIEHRLADLRAAMQETLHGIKALAEQSR